MQTRAHLRFRGWSLLVTHAQSTAKSTCLARYYPSARFRAGHGASTDFTSFSSIAQRNSALDIRYVAGLFDGEGWVRADPFTPKNRTYPRYQVQAGVGMTHRPIVEALHAEFGGTFTSYNGYAKRNPNSRTVWTWTTASLIAYRFLKAVEPHLVVKRDQALLAIELQEHVFAHKGTVQRMSAEDQVSIFEFRRGLHDEMKRLKKVEYPSVDSDPMVSAA